MTMRGRAVGVEVGPGVPEMEMVKVKVRVGWMIIIMEVQLLSEVHLEEGVIAMKEGGVMGGRRRGWGEEEGMRLVLRLEVLSRV